MVALEVMEPSEEYIGVKQAAKELGVRAETMSRYIRALDLPTKTYAQDRRFAYIPIAGLEKIHNLRATRKQRRKGIHRPNYICFQAAARELGLTPRGVDHYIKVLDLPIEKFARDGRAYLLISDFEKIKSYREARAQRKAAKEV